MSWIDNVARLKDVEVGKGAFDFDVRDAKGIDGNPNGKGDSTGNQKVDNALDNYNEALFAYKANPQDPETAAALGEAALAATAVIEDSDLPDDLKENLNEQFKESLESAKHSNSFFMDNKPVNSDEAAVDQILDDALASLDGMTEVFGANSQQSIAALNAVDTLDAARIQFEASPDDPNAVAVYGVALEAAISSVQVLDTALAADGEGNEYTSDLLDSLSQEKSQYETNETPSASLSQTLDSLSQEKSLHKTYETPSADMTQEALADIAQELRDHNSDAQASTEDMKDEYDDKIQKYKSVRNDWQQ